MPLELIDVGTTYQIMVNKLFVGMIDPTIVAYNIDMLVKSVKGLNHIPITDF